MNKADATSTGVLMPWLAYVGVCLICVLLFTGRLTGGVLTSHKGARAPVVRARSTGSLLRPCSSDSSEKIGMCLWLAGPNGEVPAATLMAPKPVAPERVAHPAATASRVSKPRPVAATRPSVTLLPTIPVDAVTDSASVAEEDMSDGGTVLQTNTTVPTLDGHNIDGWAYWSYVPMGYRFRAMGHVYRVVNRVWLPYSTGANPDGSNPNSVFGGQLDLHTCDPHGSTLTWTTRLA